MQSNVPDARYAVLMARIMHGTSRALCRSDIKDLRYSILCLDDAHPFTAQLVAGQSNVVLDASEVVVDSLHYGPPWTLDTIGYNFRHEIVLEHVPALSSCDHFRLRYEITTACGNKSILRFDVRRHQHDRN